VAGSSPAALDAEQHVSLQLNGLIRSWRLGPMLILAEPPVSGDAAIVERRLADEVDLDHPADAPGGPHQRVVGVLIGRRPVWGVTVSFPRRGPIVSASRTTAQPVEVFHEVTSELVPGS
jgi:hypothetical protein